MFKVKHILFPMDFSERCGAAAPYVAAMARRFGAKITLMNVAQPFLYSMGEIPPVTINMEEIRQSLECDLRESFVEAFDGLTVDRIVSVGDPAALITEFAEQNTVDLVMMPSHGIGPFREFLLGSVTSKVLHDSGKPVWTSAHIQGRAPLAHLEVRHILCATDVMPEDEALIRRAADFAVGIGASLRLVHVVPDFRSWPERQVDAKFEEHLKEQACRSISPIAKSLPIDVPLTVTQGDIAKAVASEAQRYATDLVILGRGVLLERLGRLRTNSYAIIRRSPCPVLSL